MWLSNDVTEAATRGQIHRKNQNDCKNARRMLFTSHRGRIKLDARNKKIIDSKKTIDISNFPLCNKVPYLVKCFCYECFILNWVVKIKSIYCNSFADRVHESTQNQVCQPKLELKGQVPYPLPKVKSSSTLAWMKCRRGFLKHPENLNVLISVKPDFQPKSDSAVLVEYFK